MNRLLWMQVKTGMLFLISIIPVIPIPICEGLISRWSFIHYVPSKKGRNLPAIMVKLIMMENCPVNAERKIAGGLFNRVPFFITKHKINGETDNGNENKEDHPEYFRIFIYISSFPNRHHERKNNGSKQEKK